MADTHPSPSRGLLDIIKTVNRNISSSELRSLWEKIQEEMIRDGPDAAVRYIDGELDRCRQTFLLEMENVETDFSRRVSS